MELRGAVEFGRSNTSLTMLSVGTVFITDKQPSKESRRILIVRTFVQSISLRVAAVL